MILVSNIFKMKIPNTYLTPYKENLRYQQIGQAVMIAALQLTGTITKVMLTYPYQVTV